MRSCDNVEFDWLRDYTWQWKRNAQEVHKEVTDYQKVLHDTFSQKVMDIYQKMSALDTHYVCQF